MKRLTLLTGILCGLICQQAIASSPQVGIAWGLNYQSYGSSCAPFGLVLDASDNVYVGQTRFNEAGSSQSVFKVLPTGTPVWESNVVAAGFVRNQGAIALNHEGNAVIVGTSYDFGHDFDYATTLMHPDGSIAWTQNLNGPLNTYDGADSVATDGLGGTFVSGGIDQVGPTPKLCLVRYSAGGVQLWTRTLTGPVGSLGMSSTHLAVDPLGNSYVSSAFSVKKGGVTKSNLFLLKYSPNGTLVYSYYDHSATNLETYDIKIDPAGNAYLCAWSYVSVYSQSDSFSRALKISPTGTLLWSTALPVPGSPSAMALDATGSVYLGGLAFTGPASDSAFIAKINSLGVYQWQKTYQPGQINSITRSVAVGGDGFVYISGYAKAGPFAAKYTQLGDQKWAINCHQASFTEDDALAMRMDRNGDIFLVGGGYESNAIYGAALTRLTQTPLVYPATYATTMGKLVSGNVEAKDAYTYGSVVQLQTSTVNGKLSMNGDGSFDYVPGQGFSGNDSFTYQLTKPIQGGSLASSIVKVTIQVK